MPAAWLDYSVIVLYFVVVIAIGTYFSGDKKTSENYLLGGRNMPYAAIGIACVMSLLSSISIVVVPGEIVNHGLTLYALSLLTLALAIPCYLMFTRFYFKLGSFTPYEYLEYRYDRTVRAVVAVSAFYTRVMYLAMVLYTTAKIFEASYGWPSPATIAVVGVVGAFYTFMGGNKAVVWTDVFQFFVLVGSFVAVIVILCLNIDGGAAAAVRVALEDGHGAPQFREASFYGVSPYVRLLFWLLLWGHIAGALTQASSDQITVQRLLSTRNWKEGFKSQIVATCFSLFFVLILWFVGLALYTYFKQNPDPMVGFRQGDRAFFRFVTLKLPSPLPGLFMAGMLAAIMSTLSAGFNSMAAIWLKEFHQKFVNKDLSPEGEVRVSKRATAVIGAFAIIFALLLVLSGKWLEQTVAEVGTLFGILGAVIMPAFLFAVLSPRANAKLIWCYTFFSFGDALGGNLWYTLSRSAQQAWLADKTLSWGWAGKLEFRYVVIPLAIGTALLLPYLCKGLRTRWPVKLSALLGMMSLGCAEVMLMWYGFSQHYIVDEPLARSFAFVSPIPFFAAFAALWFCPKQPREKYQGLTLGTLGQPIIVLRNKAVPPSP